MSDVAKILYFEIIDMTFSIDGVLGAFAFTMSIPLILIIGGFWWKFTTARAWAAPCTTSCWELPWSAWPHRDSGSPSRFVPACGVSRRLRTTGEKKYRGSSQSRRAFPWVFANVSRS